MAPMVTKPMVRFPATFDLSDKGLNRRLPCRFSKAIYTPTRIPSATTITPLNIATALTNQFTDRTSYILGDIKFGDIFVDYHMFYPKRPVRSTTKSRIPAM